MACELFTIGHSSHAIGRFLALLSRNGIELLCDVRSTPYSRFNPQFNREPLQAVLEARNIAYLFLGDMLGGNPSDGDFPADDGARFALIAGSERFRAGLARLLEETERRRTAIMCAEKDPAQCHRGLLICPNTPAGIAIHHILADGSIGTTWESRPKTRKTTPGSNLCSESRRPSGCMESLRFLLTLARFLVY